MEWDSLFVKVAYKILGIFSYKFSCEKLASHFCQQKTRHPCRYQFTRYGHPEGKSSQNRKQKKPLPFYGKRPFL
jgi:hypothetical protein